MAARRAPRPADGTRRSRPATLVAAFALGLLALTLAGCGSDGSGAKAEKEAEADGGSNATTDDGEGGDGEASAGSVTVEHRYGSTKVDGTPKRIVSLDVQWTDVLIALDAPPVGYLLDPSTEDGSFPWRGDGLADATGMTASGMNLPYEQIKELQPDLIVVSYFAEDENAYQKLTDIAPTIATLSDNEVDSWQQQAEVAGTILDQADDAAALVEDVDGQVAAVADELPGLEGKSAALVAYTPAQYLMVVADPKDGAVVLFDQLGMEVPDAIIEANDGSGRVQLSLEQATLLDSADLVVLFTNGDGDPSDLVGFDSLPAVASDALSLLDYADVTALNTPTPLSVPYALELIRPALEAAADA